MKREKKKGKRNEISLELLPGSGSYHIPRVCLCVEESKMAHMPLLIVSCPVK